MSKSTYELTVRGEKVTITFKRINDSRRLPESVNSTKDPNLFGVRSAMLCEVEIPTLLSEQWQRSSAAAQGYPLVFGGLGFCTRADQWHAKDGRHRSIRDAFCGTTSDIFVPKDLRGEIMQAFIAEEKRRENTKGSAGRPHTAKPKPRKPNALRHLTTVMEKTNEILNQIAHPKVYIDRADAIDWAGTTFGPVAKALHSRASFDHAVQETLAAAENVRPAETEHNTNG